MKSVLGRRVKQFLGARGAYINRLVASYSHVAGHAAFPLVAMACAFAATLLAVAFVPVLCALVALNRRQWGRMAICCAIGSALGATLMAWMVAEFGTQAVSSLLPGIARSSEWSAGLRWVEQYGYIALIAVAGLPASQTPVLIVCALLGMPSSEVFFSVLLGKLAKYAVCAAATARALDHANSEP